ncbi:enoyl-CoA hydratase/carnithine racemase [Jatrophihabitans sp. GAS493]|uniref:enoyl-CoA hydratase-related protein n=1 Tax=Jatrophihabitans sp. GAS493 TaxID=1907575 RepID=UPI000BB933B5|nr:enoyl-CoA hydratase-related protein [Jatrophihabitans sp. GAS493]SOD73334.1 enoyl-CoA hydratase/carnithine racemase [Jatrophihabitans sp. GAS493]
MPSLQRNEDVFILDLGDTENRFSPDWVADLNLFLDEVEAAPAPRALVTTATGKFFSNGLDLEWVMANPTQFPGYVASVQNLYARFLSLPLPTVAAIQGHCFAAGAMLALANDFRVMRADRGFFCLPEVDIRIPFTPAMAALIQARLSKKSAHEAMTTGRRYGGGDALEADIVDAVADEETLLPTAVALAASLAGKPTETLGLIKERMYVQTLELLRDRDNPLGEGGSLPTS